MKAYFRQISVQLALDPTGASKSAMITVAGPASTSITLQVGRRVTGPNGLQLHAGRDQFTPTNAYVAPRVHNNAIPATAVGYTTV